VLVVLVGFTVLGLLAVLVGFTVLGLLAYRTYQDKPRLPARVVDPAGRVLYTGAQISHGQKVSSTTA
jgi:nitric oxide reductase subunit B